MQIAGILAVLTITWLVSDDKRPLEHDDYDRWNTIAGVSISNDGAWVKYALQDGKQDVILNIRHTSSAKEYSIRGGVGAQFSFDSNYLVYRVKPDQEVIKRRKLEKKKDDLDPPDGFEMLHLASGSIVSLGQVESFQLPQKNGEWIAIRLQSVKPTDNVQRIEAENRETFEITSHGLQRVRPTRSEKNSSAKSAGETGPSQKQPASRATPELQSGKTSPPASEESTRSDTAKSKEKKPGTTLILRNLKSGTEQRIPWVVNYQFDELGTRLACSISHPSEAESAQDSVLVFDLNRTTSHTLLTGIGNYQHLAFDVRGSRLAFVTDRDDYESQDSSWSLYVWKTGETSAVKVAAEGIDGIPDGWQVSSTSKPFFDERNEFLYFFTAPRPKKAQTDDNDQQQEEKAKLDLWHWQDPLLQPQQLLRAEQEKKRSFLASYHLRTRTLRQLATMQIPDVTADPQRDSDWVLGFSEVNYQKMISWEMPGFRDVYVINVKTGESKTALTRTRSQPGLSPDGKYLIWWDHENRQWYTASIRKPEVATEISGRLAFPLFDERHDIPSEPFPFGIAGWTPRDKSVLIYDQFDVWELDPEGTGEPLCITNGRGRAGKVRFRIRQLDREARSIDLDSVVWFSAFDETTRDSGFYRLNGPLRNQPLDTNGSADTLEDATTPLQQVLMMPEQLANLQQAKHADRFIFTRATFRRFPDLWTTDLEFKIIERLSRANPHQHEYRWGNVELVSWTATDGPQIEGLFYKPDDFDPQRQYPLIVYFYERNSDNLHTHYVPAAGRSIINFSFYVSRGYLIFVPDIPYKTGEPGRSAADAVFPGVQHLIQKGFVDPKRIGVQGHSWGGYQAAYLITQSDLFACAEAGAPVSNMTSAYGGIRWESGMSRMFQYERTQSRIGDTLWNAREKYIDNSPLFFADRISTPLLILHNDRDGAVPWYQGIELFVALRRLEKPAWLLNYNGEPHWVMQDANRRDFARRMQQFFDHYLRDEPMPLWMATGIPAVEKGESFGFEPAESPPSEPAPDPKSKVNVEAN